MSARLSLAIAAGIVTLAVMPAGAVAAAVNDPASTWVPDGEVRAVALSGSTAYIGGNFSRIAPYTGSSALFDASNGELKKPWPEVEGVVNAVVPDGAGGWYLGGDFRSVGGVPRTDLAHVMPDGTVDPNFAPTTDGLVRALAVGTGTVFAGGEFSTANGEARENLAGFTAATGALTGFVGSVSDGVRRSSIRSGSTHFCSSARRCTRPESSTRRRAVSLSRPACGGRRSTSPTVRSWRGIPAPTA